MAPRKLSDQDKQDVVELYKQVGETTSTIAERYGVSNSTISRILKTLVPEDEYSLLVTQKRQGTVATVNAVPSEAEDSSPVAEPVAEPTVETAVDDADIAASSKPKRRTKKRITTVAAATQSELDIAATSSEDSEPVVSKKPAPPRRRSRVVDGEEEQTQLPLLETDVSAADVLGASAATKEGRPPVKSIDIGIADVAEESPLVEDVEYDEINDEDEDLDDLNGDIDDVMDDDFDDDEDFEDEDDSGDDAGDDGFVAPHLAPKVQIVPLSEATFPRTCYLVIDRLSELITRPLSDFADLGQLSASEERAKTLPIFDNHRVARRFSRRNQRVIKVPNGQLFTKTQPYLQAKGISHLLIDGNVYSLVGETSGLSKTD